MRALVRSRRGRPSWRRLARRLALLYSAGWCAWLGAGDAQPADGGEIGIDPAGGELLQFEEFPTVVSVTRQASASNVSSVPVSVITAQQIHQRGVMTLPQLFEFVPGMDVVRIDRNRTMVGIRGMFGSTQDRVLSLVDGQKTAEVSSGSTNWQSFPVFLEDIKQIEVVKGPSGAAWGANAFYGVINVRTKDPEETQGLMTTAATDQFGDVYTQGRWGGSSGPARWRISGGYNSHVPGNVANDRTAKTHDGGFTAMTDSRLVVEADAKTKLTFGFSYLHQELDTPTLINLASNRPTRRDLARGFLTYDIEISESLKTTWTALYNYADNQLPTSWSSRDREAGLEGQFDYSGLAGHQISYGGSFRYMRGDNYTRGGAEEWRFIDDPNTETWGGLFLVDRYQVNPRTWLEVQGRGDLFKFQQQTQRGDWSGRVAGIYALDDGLNHVFRISGAKSYRAPTILLRATDLHRVLLPAPPFPPNTYALNVAAGNHMRTETIWSLEAGYTGRLNPSVSLQANGFYQRLFHLISAERTAVLGPAEFYTTGNIDGATQLGGEIELEYHWKEKNLTARAYYAYVYFHADHPDVLLRADPPAPNKVGATLDWGFLPDFTANLLYRYNDLTPGDSGGNRSVRAFNQMDINLLYSIPDSVLSRAHGEVLISVTDVFNDTAIGASDIGTFGTPESVPGRTFVVRGSLQF